MYKYERIAIIGSGSYGQVAKAKHRKSGQIVAIKRFIETEQDMNIRRMALREINLLKHLRHPNIVNMLEVFRRNHHFFLVFEYMERTLLDEIESNPKGLNHRDVREYSYQLLRGLEYCHSNHVIHRDIKPENVLINQSQVVKLCDFGFARLFTDDNRESMTDYVATRWYRAPELLVGDSFYGKEVDVWGFGCMLAEMMSGDALFPGDTDIDQLYRIICILGRLTDRQQAFILKSPNLVSLKKVFGQRPVSLAKLFPLWPENIREIISWSLKLEPKSRATCSDILNHKWFHDDGFSKRFDIELERRLKEDAVINPLLTFYEKMTEGARQAREKLIFNLPRIRTPSPVVKKNKWITKRWHRDNYPYLFSKPFYMLLIDMTFRRILESLYHMMYQGPRLEEDDDERPSFHWHIHGPKPPAPKLKEQYPYCSKECRRKPRHERYSDFTAAGDPLIFGRTNYKGNIETSLRYSAIDEKNIYGNGDPLVFPPVCNHRYSVVKKHKSEQTDFNPSTAELPMPIISSGVNPGNLLTPLSFISTSSLDTSSEDIEFEILPTAASPMEPAKISKALKNLSDDNFGQIPEHCELICKPKAGSGLIIQMEQLHKTNRDTIRNISKCQCYREPITLTNLYEKPLVQFYSPPLAVKKRAISNLRRL